MSGRNAEEALAGVVTRDPDVAGGEPVFAGTAVPVRDLIEHLKAGDPLIDFTGHRHTAVTHGQTIAYLEATVEVAGWLARPRESR